MIVLVLALLVVFLAIGREPRRGRSDVASPGRIFAAYVVPAVVLLVFFVWHRDATRWRFALLGYGFRGQEGERIEATIGGDWARDEIWISRLPLLDPEESTLPRFVLTVSDSEVPSSGVTDLALHIGEAATNSVITREPNHTPFNAIPLFDGDVIRTPHTDWRVHGRTLVGPTDEAREIPGRTSRIPFIDFELPVWRPLPVTSRTYPLAATEGSELREAGSLQSFLYFEPAWFRESRLLLADLDDTVVVLRNNDVIDAPKEALLREGERIYIEGLPRWDGVRFQAGGIRDHRSMRIRTGTRSFALELDTPEVIVLDRNDLRKAPEIDQGRLLEIGVGDTPLAYTGLHFRHVSRKISGECRATVVFPASSLLHQQRLELLTPAGLREVRLGEPFWLGTKRLAALQIDVLKLPLGLALFWLFVAVAKGVAGASIGLSRRAVTLVACVEALLVIRLLLGYRIWAMRPFEPKGMELALAVSLLLPWVLLAALVPPLSSRSARGSRIWQHAWAPVGAGLLLSLCWCLRLSEGGTWKLTWIACHIAALSIPLARSFQPWRSWRILHWIKAPHNRPVLLWWGLALLFTLVRTGLVLFGAKESLPVSPRISLALFHVPAAILLEAAYLRWLWTRVSAGRLPRLVDYTPVIAIILLVWGAPGVLASDLGLILLNLPIFFAGLVTIGFHTYRSSGWKLLVHRGTTVGLALVFLLLFALPFALRGGIAMMPEDTRLRYSSERNFLRLVLWAYPDELERFGVRTSEELNIMGAVMSAYTSAPVFGRGFGNTELSPHLGVTSVREHTVSVFVASEWGWAGGLGLLAIYLTAAWLGWRVLSSGWLDPAGRHAMDTREPPFSCVVGGLSALTFGLSSVWMTMANYQWALFTGKNARLLGLDSTTDVLLSVTLVYLAAAALDRRRAGGPA